uniref:SFRICE_013499 n=1 Tax=Spodoptera frugiperda TaxID=7108 RepID=A0A2H1WLA1_SPOFR
MAAQQEESLLSRCEIPIIDLAHIGEHLHPTACNLHRSAACAALISESAALNTTTLAIHLTIHSLGKSLYC